MNIYCYHPLIIQPQTHAPLTRPKAPRVFTVHTDWTVNPSKQHEERFKTFKSNNLWNTLFSSDWVTVPHKLHCQWKQKSTSNRCWKHTEILCCVKNLHHKRPENVIFPFFLHQAEIRSPPKESCWIIKASLTQTTAEWWHLIINHLQQRPAASGSLLRFNGEPFRRTRGPFSQVGNGGEWQRSEKQGSISLI